MCVCACVVSILFPESVRMNRFSRVDARQMYLSELRFELHCSIVALWFARWQAALRLLMQMPEAWCPLVGAGLVP